MNATSFEPMLQDNGKGTDFPDTPQGLDALNAAFDDEQHKPAKRPKNETAAEKCRELLEALLRDVQPIDFDARIPHEEGKTPSYAEKYVAIIEELQRLAYAKNWGICRNGAFVYLFNGTYWQPIDRDELKHFLSQAAYLMGLPEYHAHQAEVADKLLKQFDFTGFKQQPESDNILINLQNGTLEIDGEGYHLRDFDEADFLKYQLPFAYDENATAPMFENYLNKVLPDVSAQRVLAEYCGYIFAKQLKLEKALILYGDGANGKSVFFDILTAMLGKANVSNYDMGSLCDDSGYYRAMIQNTLVNYGSEIGTSKQYKSDTFKKLVSCEPIQARLPYRPPFEIQGYARLMFNANTLPQNVEQTNAYFRRFLIIPFEVTIPPAEQDKDLAKKIVADELPGVLNWVLDGLKRVVKNRDFSPCAAADKALETYKVESCSVLSFVTENYYVADTKNAVPLQALFEEYRTYCYNNGFVAASNKTFSKRLKVAGFEVQKPGSGARVVYCRKDVPFDEAMGDPFSNGSTSDEPQFERGCSHV